MSVFAIGDLHLSFGSNKPMDVFHGWENHAERIEKNWKKTVSPDDTVVIPGDISWAINYGEVVPDMEFIDALPGKKILLKGNHDYWWDTMSKNNRMLKENGFNSIEFLFNNSVAVQDIAVCGTRSWFFDADNGDKKILLREIGRLKRSIDHAKASGLEPVVFLHYPPLTTGECCKEIIDVLEQEKIRKCYYAHMHGASIRSAFNGRLNDVNYRLVSADSLSFCPYLIQK